MVDEDGGPVAARQPRSAVSAAAGFDALVADLRRLRQAGLVELRRLALRSFGGGPAAAEEALRAAVDALGSGRLGTAAQYTFGLAQGTRDWPAQDRRRRAAQEYGLSIERFRRQQERIILEQVAEQILALGFAVRQPDPAVESAVAPDTGRSAGWSADRGVDRGVDRATAPPYAQEIPPTAAAATNPSPAAPPAPSTGDEFVFEVGAHASGATVTVHVLPIELTRDIDVLVSTSNVYFEISRIFGNTVSAGLRRAAARTDPAGRIVDDVVQRELAAWVAEHGGPGTAVPPGTVAPTGPGTLAERGIRRIYHAAVAVPVDSGIRYVVEETSIVRAVHAVFSSAALERRRFDPPLGSLCFPLIGSGRGGMEPDRSIRMLWLALREESRRDPSWQVHIAIKDAALAERLIEHVLADGARPVLEANARPAPETNAVPEG